MQRNCSLWLRHRCSSRKVLWKHTQACVAAQGSSRARQSILRSKLQQRIRWRLARQRMAWRANFSVVDLHGEGLDMCCSFLGSWAFELRGLSLAHLPISDLSRFAANVPNAAYLQWLDLSHQRLTARVSSPLAGRGRTRCVAISAVTPPQS